jgi:hypothetical protein
MIPKQVLSKAMCPETEEARREMAKVPYREAVGSIMYLAVCTRPDLCKAISNASRFLDNPGPQHWQAVKRIFRYLKGTRDLKLHLGGNTELNLCAYSDADWGGDTDSGRSTTGFVIFLGNSPICWKSRLQTPIALSTVEAEYYAMVDSTRELLYILPLTADMELHQKLPLTINEDNQGCQAVAEKSINNPRTKHINIKYHWIKDKITDGTIKIQYCPTDKMIADVLTKGLEHIKHNKFTNLLGLRKSSETIARGSVEIEERVSSDIPVKSSKHV